MKITSLQNPLIKSFAKLQQSRQRRTMRRFIVETERTLTRVIASGYRVETILYEAEIAELSCVRAAVEHGAEGVEVTRRIIEKLSYRKHPTGFVGVVVAREHDVERVYSGGLLVVCDGLEKPGNVGAILRTVEAAGLGRDGGGVMIEGESVDLYNPQTIRASTGAVFGLPIGCGSADAIVGWCLEHGYQIVAASPEASIDYAGYSFTQRTALVMGAEAEGLSAKWRGAADALVSIPMRGQVVDSLNVSVAAALLVFEAMRGGGDKQI